MIYVDICMWYYILYLRMLVPISYESIEFILKQLCTTIPQNVSGKKIGFHNFKFSFLKFHYAKRNFKYCIFKKSLNIYKTNISRRNNNNNNNNNKMQSLCFTFFLMTLRLFLWSLKFNFCHTQNFCVLLDFVTKVPNSQNATIKRMQKIKVYRIKIFLPLFFIVAIKLLIPY